MRRPTARLARASALSIVFVAAVLAGAAVVPSAGATDAAPAGTDTLGRALMEWAYDSWTVPWVQVRGAAHVLGPGSHATLMVLACETADLERDRLARHLSAEECEHRMAAIRADQDSALIFRLQLNTLDSPGSDALARLGPRDTISLEDDGGGRWSPMEVIRGPVVPLTAGGEIKRIHYRPSWLRGGQYSYADEYALVDARPTTVAEHRLRFARRDRRTARLILSSETRWLRLRLVSGTNEWVATWTFRPGERP